MVLIGAQGGVCYIEGRNNIGIMLRIFSCCNRRLRRRASDGNSRQKDCGFLKVRLSTRSMETLMPFVKKFLISSMKHLLHLLET
uniref:Uncharacterized protein n=1 Tax=Ditylenchus dipsaci TaxID=166011 RepID=A0A915D8X0_9BILA